ncbi:hypothetical protein CEXT_216311 [Caerostris extrusa]|uniref:Uncharacterized protein n=1 Tax=Caerostris extrusa TaxID=172846 RepID=A0AAV4Y7H1_CAEEX|nr:hypothetical protein CEXT_216311 [Caerostris extrusa]
MDEISRVACGTRLYEFQLIEKRSNQRTLLITSDEFRKTNRIKSGGLLYLYCSRVIFYEILFLFLLSCLPVSSSNRKHDQIVGLESGEHLLLNFYSRSFKD